MYESALRGAIPLASNTKRSLTSDSLLNCSLIITDNRRPKDLLRPRICKECARYNPASV